MGTSPHVCFLDPQVAQTILLLLLLSLVLALAFKSRARGRQGGGRESIPRCSGVPKHFTPCTERSPSVPAALRAGFAGMFIQRDRASEPLARPRPGRPCLSRGWELGLSQGRGSSEIERISKPLIVRGQTHGKRGSQGF